jgi:hypothetical protein
MKVPKAIADPMLLNVKAGSSQAFFVLFCEKKLFSVTKTEILSDSKGGCPFTSRLQQQCVRYICAQCTVKVQAMTI